MHRIIAVLALVSAAFGLWVLVGGSTEPDVMGRGAGGSAGFLGTYSVWSIGLVMGLGIAWIVTVDWKNFPERFVDWLRLQRRRCALLLLGGACASVLLLF
jgi:hypothetical protein